MIINLVCALKLGKLEYIGEFVELQSVSNKFNYHTSMLYCS